MSKQDVLKLINSLPDDISFEDVLYHLYMMYNIDAGITDIQEGRSYTHDKVKEMFQ
ncbi:MAG: hypothetical protein WBJ13_00170 [Sedimentibacter sp.]